MAGDTRGSDTVHCTHEVRTQGHSDGDARKANAWMPSLEHIYAVHAGEIRQGATKAMATGEFYVARYTVCRLRHLSSDRPDPRDATCEILRRAALSCSVLAASGRLHGRYLTSLPYGTVWCVCTDRRPAGPTSTRPRAARASPRQEIPYKVLLWYSRPNSTSNLYVRCSR